MGVLRIDEYSPVCPGCGSAEGASGFGSFYGTASGQYPSADLWSPECGGLFFVQWDQADFSIDEQLDEEFVSFSAKTSRVGTGVLSDVCHGCGKRDHPLGEHRERSNDVRLFFPR